MVWPEQYPSYVIMGGLCRSCSIGLDVWDTPNGGEPCCMVVCEWYPDPHHNGLEYGDPVTRSGWPCDYYRPGPEREAPDMPEFCIKKQRRLYDFNK